MRSLIRWVFVLGALVAPFAAIAGEREELSELRNTVVGLLDALVEQGILSREQADGMVKKAQEKAAAQAAQLPSGEPGDTETVASPGATAGPGASPADQAAAEALADAGTDSKVVRVPYVPEFVKDEIRQQVRAELRNEVLEDVKQTAKAEKWGTPDALPAWVNKIKISGDVRLRDEYDQFSDNNPDSLNNVNPLYLDILALNDDGSYDCIPDCNLNTSIDRNRARARVRLGLSAAITDKLKFGARLTTGNQKDPVSTNQTLGNTGNRYDVQLDQAFLRYESLYNGNPFFDVAAGRIPNPWFSTDLVWDEDLTFEGAAMTFRGSIAGASNLLEMQDRSRQIFVTLGAFPLDEIELSGRDKLLLGAQVGTEWTLQNQSKFKLGVAYYDYRNVTGRRNPNPDDGSFDYSAPEFSQTGNLMFDIRNHADVLIDPNDVLLALASDYNLLNLTGSMDLAFLAPIHVVLTGDVVTNIGYDKDDILERTQGANLVFHGNTRTDSSARTLGYNLDLNVGWPKIDKWGDWQVFATYKYLERDAVLDAFTDSDFHLGGTDAKGYILGAKFGIAKNTWLRARWLSADEIDGAPLGIDVLQLDLNARF